MTGVGGKLSSTEPVAEDIQSPFQILFSWDLIKSLVYLGAKSRDIEFEADDLAQWRASKQPGDNGLLAKKTCTDGPEVARLE